VLIEDSNTSRHIQKLDENVFCRLKNVSTGPFRLEFDGEKLSLSVSDASELGFSGVKKISPLVFDWTQSWKKARRERPQLRNGTFGKALGQKLSSIHLLDTTCGAGEDSLKALALDCRVTAVERSPILAALVLDAIHRARQEREFNALLDEKFTFIFSDARDVMLAQPADFDVIYVDPMFPEKRKSAASMIKMRVFHMIVGDDLDAHQTVAKALEMNAQRLIIKRPLRGEALWPEPTHSFRGSSTRYDMYILSAKERGR
jgi:16S rRNA (guanine1516-N2)-methyltransferase